MPRFDCPSSRNSAFHFFGAENQRIGIPRRHQPPLRFTAKAISRSHSQRIGPLADSISGSKLRGSKSSISYSMAVCYW